jgi:uncharacterized membrane protein YvbJ
MRPCGKCGCPAENDLQICDRCRADTLANDKTERDARTKIDEGEVDDRSSIRKFLFWSFTILTIALPLLGYLLGGIPIAVVFGILGMTIFVMLEQLSH